MPTQFNFDALKSPSVARIGSLALGDAPFVVWSYSGIYKNRNDNSQPLALIGLRQLLEDKFVADKVIFRRVPLTALGQVRIGTIWQEGVSDAIYCFDTKDFDVEFEIGKWRLVSFSSRVNGTTPYPMSIHPLEYPGDKNWYIEFDLLNGGKLVVPCLEFFARCYGRSNELNRVLATYEWEEACRRLYAPIDEPEEINKWKVKLKKRLHNGDTTFLAHAKYDPYTTRAAKSVHAQIESQYSSDPKASPCFLKVTPWFQGPAELRCQGIWFNDGRSFLALRINGCSDPDGILIERNRENTNKNFEGEPDQEGQAWNGAPEKRLVRPPDIVDLTGDDAPDHGASNVEILDTQFITLGVPRTIVDKYGKRISSSSKNRRKGGDDSRYSSGEAYGSEKGVGYASIYAPVELESHGALLDIWNAANSLKTRHPDSIQSVDWFTFSDGYQRISPPKLIAIEPVDEESDQAVPIQTKNWCFFDLKIKRMRGVMVLRLIADSKPIYIVEIERRTRTTTGEGSEIKEVEEPFRGFVTTIENGEDFQQWLRRFLSDVRYVRGIVRKLVPAALGRADTFKHPKSRGDYVLGEPALLNALEKMGVLISTKSPEHHVGTGEVSQ